MWRASKWSKLENYNVFFKQSELYLASHQRWHGETLYPCPAGGLWHALPSTGGLGGWQDTGGLTPGWSFLDMISTLFWSWCISFFCLLLTSSSRIIISLYKLYRISDDLLIQRNKKVEAQPRPFYSSELVNRLKSYTIYIIYRLHCKSPYFSSMPTWWRLSGTVSTVLWNWQPRKKTEPIFRKSARSVSRGCTAVYTVAFLLNLNLA